MERRTVLLDNGSLKPEAALSLRRIASELSARVGEEVHPVSLLHSSKIPAEELGGQPAETWRRFLKRELSAGRRSFRVLPLFFGPSGAIVDYLPKVSSEIVGEQEAGIRIGDPLVKLAAPEDDAVAQLLAGLLIRKLDTRSEGRAVILVDHGSPARAVADCRNLVAEQLARLLEGKVAEVIAASMERRDGEEYAFNEPLLERALERARERGYDKIWLSLMFFSPGRHAGPGGDIAQIVERSRFVAEGGAVEMAPLAGESPLLIDLLERRYRELMTSDR